MVVHQTSQQEVGSIIHKLPNKMSSGYDKISNVLLKQLNKALSYPLTIIFNCSLSKGKFPDMMKLAKIILLYKGKEQDATINYRPVSLIITISKVLEKIMYKRTYHFVMRNNIFFKSQYGF